MHPLLFRIPLPSQHLSLTAPLLVTAVLALLVAGLGFFRRSRELLVAGSVGAFAALAAALFFRERVLVLGALPLPAFGVLLALALTLGAWLTLRAAGRNGLPLALAGDMGVAAIIGGVLGARLVTCCCTRANSRHWACLHSATGGSRHTAQCSVASPALLRGQRRGTPLLPWLTRPHQASRSASRYALRLARRL